MATIYDIINNDLIRDYIFDKLNFNDIDNFKLTCDEFSNLSYIKKYLRVIGEYKNINLHKILYENDIEKITINDNNELCYIFLRCILFETKITNSKMYRYHIDNNRIEKNNKIMNLENLTYLNLSFNEIRSKNLEFIDYLPNIKHLILSHNRITILSYSLCRTKPLESLDLSNNEISYIPKIIMDLKNLKKLNLNKNPITEIQEKDIIKYLKKFGVTFDNPITINPFVKRDDENNEKQNYYFRLKNIDLYLYNRWNMKFKFF